MTDNPVGKTYSVKEHHWVHGLMGLPVGNYEVFVGDYGWDDGDLYIRGTDGTKYKLRDIKE